MCYIPALTRPQDADVNRRGQFQAPAPRTALMNFKTYRAKTIADALSEVKKDLGKDAVILHTRSFKSGGVMGLGGRVTVEVTAAPAMQINPVQRAARPVPEPAASPACAAAAPSSDGFVSWLAPRFTGASEAGRPATVIDRSQPLTQAPVIVSRAPGVRRPSPRDLSTSVQPAPTDPNTRLVLEEELSAIKRLVGQVLQCTRHTPAPGTQAAGVPASDAVLTLGPMSEPLFANYMRLVEGQVSTELAEALAGDVRAELSGHELSDPATVRSVLMRLLAARLPVTGEPARLPRSNDGRPFTVALIGPTGVGKTTTIAKLAAVQKLRHNRRVGLVTCDTYRIAAVEQLRTYAAIIGLPLKIVGSPGEVEAACRSLDSCEVVMVDTAGRSQHDSGRIDELSRLLALIKPHETHLVLSAAAAEPVMLKAAERFGVLRPSCLLFTKLDEAVHFGPLLNAVARTGLRIGYITTGQEVPDHIEAADSTRLARAIIDGEVPS